MTETVEQQLELAIDASWRAAVACDAGRDEGWRDAIGAFGEQWRSKPDKLSREELIARAHRLLLLLDPDPANLTEEEIAARTRR